MPRGNVVEIIVRGPAGSGKSALLGEIEILLRAIGIKYSYEDPADAQSEKNATRSDWQHWLEVYEPQVILIERSIPLADQAVPGGLPPVV